MAALICLLGLFTACAPLPVATPTPAASLWTRYQIGLPTHATVLALAVSPHASAMLFAGAYDTTGAYVSSDQARSWRAASAGLEGEAVFALRFIRDALFAGTTGGLYRWAGDQWERIPSIPIGPVYSIARGIAGGWYLVTDTHGIFTSADGTAWTHVAGLEGEPLACVAALDARTLFAGTTGQGAFVTRDGGSTWQPLDAFRSDYVSFISIDPRDGKSIYLRTRRGLFRSRDGGATWQELRGGIQNELVNAVLFDAASSRIVAATDSGGVYISGDDGATWQSSSRGLPQGVASYALAQLDAQTILLGAQNGIYVSRDAGNTWQSANDGVGVPQIHALELDPQTGLLLAATEDGLYRQELTSGRAGTNGPFVRIGDETIQYPTLSIALAPTDRQVIYIGTYRHGIFVSQDGGATWSSVGGIFQDRLSVPGLAVDPRDDRTVFARVLFQRIYKSTDGGAAWHSVWTGMPNEAQVETMVLAPDDPAEMFAGTNIGLFSSGDGGESWTPRAFAQETVFSIWIDPRHTRTLLAGATDGLYRSDDGGASWTRIALAQTTVTAILRDPHGNFYVGTKYNGVWTSRDGAKTWTQYGLDGESIVTLVGDDTRGLLYAATTHGLFKASTEP